MAKRKHDVALTGTKGVEADASVSKKSKNEGLSNKLKGNRNDAEAPEHSIGQPSREDRKERKRLQNLQKAEETLAAETGTPKDLAVPNADLKAQGKAERRAKKAELKVAKRAKKEARKEAEPSAVPHPSGGLPNGTSQTHEASAPDSNGTNGHASVQKSGTTSPYLENAELTAISASEIEAFKTKNAISIRNPSSYTSLRPITSFAYLPTVNDEYQAHFRDFASPTPIQAAAWPFLFAGRDVVGIAETGSGKTLAFALPCIRYISLLRESLGKKGAKGVRAVVVSPTRELALQIHEQIEKYASSAGLGVVCVYGGVSKEEQRATLKTASIVVATPGRLNDLINEGSADLSKVGYLVLDEGDRMLDKGFEEDIRKIITTTPSSNRQTLMFTATWPPSVRELAETFLSQPVHISIGADNPTNDLRANERITQKVEVVDPRGKEQRLLQLLKKYQGGTQKDDRILVFCLYKKEATRIEGFLKARWGTRVAGIHGDLSQAQRTASLAAFKTGKITVLVATDVAARGLDIPAVKAVINVTFPLTVEDYVHRIGRTGRAGKEGLAITLFTDHDKGQSGALINVLKAANQPVPEELLKFGTTVKKKGHEAYGAFYKEPADSAKAATKIKFDD